MPVVFFDAAGTLIRVRGGVGEQYAEVASAFGVDADPRALEWSFPAPSGRRRRWPFPVRRPA